MKFSISRGWSTRVAEMSLVPFFAAIRLPGA